MHFPVKRPDYQGLTKLVPLCISIRHLHSSMIHYYMVRMPGSSKHTKRGGNANGKYLTFREGAWSWQWMQMNSQFGPFPAYAKKRAALSETSPVQIQDESSALTWLKNTPKIPFALKNMGLFWKQVRRQACCIWLSYNYRTDQALTPL